MPLTQPKDEFSPLPPQIKTDPEHFDLPMVQDQPKDVTTGPIQVNIVNPNDGKQVDLDQEVSMTEIDEEELEYNTTLLQMKHASDR